MTMIKEELGRRWLEPDLFRFGASSLLGDIERQLDHFSSGFYSSSYRHPIAQDFIMTLLKSFDNLDYSEAFESNKEAQDWLEKNGRRFGQLINGKLFQIINPA